MSTREHWTSYWEATDTKAACLPSPESPAALVMDARWADLAAGLPGGAKVVDLACGMGAAGKAMLSAAPHLDMTGVDYAEIANSEDVGFPVQGKVDLEDLPLEDASVDCAVSQYGFEYAGEAATGELVRILKPGAPCRLLVHHRGSAVVRVNFVRASILASLIARRVDGLVEEHNPAGLQTVFDHMIETYGEHPLVLEIATVCRDSLRLPDDKRAEVSQRLGAGMRRERALLDALADAAMDEGDIDALKAATSGEMTWEEPRVLHASEEENAPILCWELDGQRTAS